MDPFTGMALLGGALGLLSNKKSKANTVPQYQAPPPPNLPTFDPANLPAFNAPGLSMLPQFMGVPQYQGATQPYAQYNAGNVYDPLKSGLYGSLNEEQAKLLSSPHLPEEYVNAVRARAMSGLNEDYQRSTRQAYEQANAMNLLGAGGTGVRLGRIDQGYANASRDIQESLTAEEIRAAMQQRQYLLNLLGQMQSQASSQSLQGEQMRLGQENQAEQFRQRGEEMRLNQGNLAEQMRLSQGNLAEQTRWNQAMEAEQQRLSQGNLAEQMRLSQGNNVANALYGYNQNNAQMQLQQQNQGWEAQNARNQNMFNTVFNTASTLAMPGMLKQMGPLFQGAQQPQQYGAGYQPVTYGRLANPQQSMGGGWDFMGSTGAVDQAKMAYSQPRKPTFNWFGRGFG